MKKTILSIMAICLANAFAFSQCTKTYSSTGVYPPQLPDAYEQVQYNQEIDFTFPVDTVVQGYSVHIDSLIIYKVVGFPGSNFTFNCNVKNCTYVATTGMKYYQGCFMIKGTAPKGSSGTYKLKVDLEGYFSTPFGSQTYIVTDSSVNLNVNGCNTTAKVKTTGNTMFCKGGSVKLNASGGNKFQWLKYDVVMPNDTTDSIIVTTYGVYRALVWDAATGCFDTSSTNMIIVLPVPTKPTVTAGATTITTSATGVTYQWYKDTTLIVGATSQTYTPLTNGKYKLRVMNTEGCVNFSDAYDFKNTNITDIIGLHSLNVFPNPTSNMANLEFISATKQAVQISIIDVNGKIIMTQSINSNTNKNTIALDLSSYAKGIYLVKLQTNNGQQIQRLTVE